MRMPGETSRAERPARRNDGLLRTALKLDALATGPTSVAYVLAAAPLGELLALPAWVLRAAGAFLLLFAALVWVTARASSIASASVAAIVATNAIWATGSIAAAIADWGSPAPIGTVLIVAQAIFGAAFGVAEYVGLRRAVGRPRRTNP